MRPQGGGSQSHILRADFPLRSGSQVHTTKWQPLWRRWWRWRWRRQRTRCVRLRAGPRSALRSKPQAPKCVKVLSTEPILAVGLQNALQLQFRANAIHNALVVLLQPTGRKVRLHALLYGGIVQEGAQKRTERTASVLALFAVHQNVVAQHPVVHTELHTRCKSSRPRAPVELASEVQVEPHSVASGRKLVVLVGAVHDAHC